MSQKKSQSHKQHADTPSQLITDVVIIISWSMNNNTKRTITQLTTQSPQAFKPVRRTLDFEKIGESTEGTGVTGRVFIRGE